MGCSARELCCCCCCCCCLLLLPRLLPRILVLLFPRFSPIIIIIIIPHRRIEDLFEHFRSLGVKTWPELSNGSAAASSYLCQKHIRCHPRPPSAGVVIIPKNYDASGDVILYRQRLQITAEGASSHVRQRRQMAITKRNE